MANRPKALVKRVMEAGEAQIDRMVHQVLTNESFIAAVQGVVSKSLAAKGSIDKSLRSALSTMNLPTSTDLAELRKRLDRLDRTLAEVDGKLGRLEKEKLSARAAAAPGSASPAPKAKRASATPGAKEKAAGTKAAAAKKATKAKPKAG